MPTVAALTASFVQVLDAAVAAGRTAAATRDAYRYQLRHLDRAAGGLDAAALVPDDLAAAPFTPHFTAAVRRVFRWASDKGTIPAYRFAAFLGPLKGQRDRVISAAEFRAVRAAAGPALRRVLWFLRHTFARPGEARELRWADVSLDEACVRLRRFKARDRRRDGVRVRVIPLVPVVVRLLRYWWQRRRPAAGDRVFLNSRGRPWSVSALRLGMHRAADRAGVNRGEGERVVCYTLRHTGATEATRRGVRDRVLADILGHTTTRTTARYQHLQVADLVAAMKTATGHPPSPPRSTGVPAGSAGSAGSNAANTSTTASAISAPV